MGIMFPGLLGIAEHLAEIPGAGYDLLGHFCLPEVVWWQDYYGPLEARIKVLWEEYGRVPEARVLLEEALREVDSYRRCARWYGSAFFIMQRGERQ
jgi:hypothetical protein